MSSTELFRSSTESPKRYIKQKTDRYIKQKNDRETFKKLVPFFFFSTFYHKPKTFTVAKYEQCEVFALPDIQVTVPSLKQLMCHSYGHRSWNSNSLQISSETGFWAIYI